MGDLHLICIVHPDTLADSSGQKIRERKKTIMNLKRYAGLPAEGTGCTFIRPGSLLTSSLALCHSSISLYFYLLCDNFKKSFTATEAQKM
jgi:hypothetical protein